MTEAAGSGTSSSSPSKGALWCDQHAKMHQNNRQSLFELEVSGTKSSTKLSAHSLITKQCDKGDQRQKPPPSGVPFTWVWPKKPAPHYCVVTLKPPLILLRKSISLQLLDVFPCHLHPLMVKLLSGMDRSKRTCKCWLDQVNKVVTKMKKWKEQLNALLGSNIFVGIGEGHIRLVFTFVKIMCWLFCVMLSGA